jgi:farnesyl-diphosphate farnesyltransferase
MEKDLTRFPHPEGTGAWAAEPVAIATMVELDEHTYLAAGCVGEYWTTMTAAHVPAVQRLGRPDYVARGIRLGKALQLVNVMRDAGRDLREGRSYLPTELLERHAVRPSELVRPELRQRGRSVLAVLGGMCLEHIDAAFPYVLAIPRTEARLRLAALWPLWIGLATLERLRDAADPLDPAHPVKIGRGDVYTLMAESLAVVGSDKLLGLAHDRRRRRAE